MFADVLNKHPLVIFILTILTIPGCIDDVETPQNYSSNSLSPHQIESVKLIETHWAARRLYDDTWYRYHSLKDQELYDHSLSEASHPRIDRPMTSDQVNAICDLAIIDRENHFNRTEVEWHFDTISISQRKLRKMIHTIPENYYETERLSPAYQWYAYYWYQALAESDPDWDYDPYNEKFEEIVRDFGDFKLQSEARYLARRDVNSNNWFEGDRTY